MLVDPLVGDFIVNVNVVSLPSPVKVCVALAPNETV
jgi:hypothetical protein